MPIKLNSAGGGSVTLDVPSTASTFTLTAPARTGNIITSADSSTVTQAMLGAGVAGNGPAFYAYQSAAQTIATTTSTKVSLQTELFDTNSNFDSTTNYRFTPTVAGYYKLTGTFYFSFTGSVQLYLYKNGSTYLSGPYIAGIGSTVTGLMYMNGTTDYAELFIYAQNGFTSNQLNAQSTTFQGFLARSA